MTKLENKEFTIVPDIRTYKMLRDEMRAVYQELSRIRDCSKMDERLAVKVDLLTELFIGIASKASVSPFEQEDSLIELIKRD